MEGLHCFGNIQLTILLPQLKASNLTISWELDVNLVAVADDTYNYHAVSDDTYNYHAVSASDNSRIISGEKAHGGVHCFGNIQLTILLPQLKASNLTVSWELDVNLVAVDLCLF